MFLIALVFIYFFITLDMFSAQYVCLPKYTKCTSVNCINTCMHEYFISEITFSLVAIYCFASVFYVLKGEKDSLYTAWASQVLRIIYKTWAVFEFFSPLLFLVCRNSLSKKLSDVLILLFLYFIKHINNFHNWKHLFVLF